jgi:predicted RNA-binding protein Jag
LDKDIQIGDLVRISNMVHEDGIPESRVVVVLSKSTQDSYNIIGNHGKVLRFHESLIEIVAKAQEDDAI